MNELRFPLKTVLREAGDEAAVHRVHQRIQASRAAAPTRGPRRALTVTLALAGLGAAILVIGRWRDAGPLRLADGAAVAPVEAAAAEVRVSLSDGSEILLSPGSRLEPLETSGVAFNAVLARGRATFDVRPGGPRRWTIECGLATVEVLGTRFACAREPERLHVNVERGSVLVRGELVPDRARRLTMGESIDVVAAGQRSARTSSTASAGASEVSPSPPAHDRPIRPLASTEPRSATRSGVPARTRRAALREEPPAGDDTAAGDVQPTARPSAADLLARADEARIKGRPADAVAPLERILSEMASDPQAPLAAFALGRLEIDSLGRPRRAARAFEQAISLGLPRSLEEEARARLVEAYDRLGDSFAANDAARDLLKAFPSGHHSSAMRARLSQP